jgi:hypothetical protein
MVWHCCFDEIVDFRVDVLPHPHPLLCFALLLSPGCPDGRYVGNFASQMASMGVSRQEQYLNFRRHFAGMLLSRVPRCSAGCPCMHASGPHCQCLARSPCTSVLPTRATRPGD